MYPCTKNIDRDITINIISGIHKPGKNDTDILCMDCKPDGAPIATYRPNAKGGYYWNWSNFVKHYQTCGKIIFFL